MVHGSVCGTLRSWRWMAPEALSESLEKYDQRADTYSFGIILWELVTISLPFDEFANDTKYKKGNWEENLTKAIIEDHVRPTIPLDCPIEIANLIASCWNSKIEKRPTSAVICATLANALGMSDEIPCDSLSRNRLLFRKQTTLNLSDSLPEIQSNTPKARMEIIDKSARYSASTAVPKQNTVWVGTSTGDILICKKVCFQFILFERSRIVNIG